MKGKMISVGKFGALFAVALLAGCTVVPGSYHSPTPGWFIDETEMAQGKPLPDVVKVHAIGTAILDQKTIAPEEKPVPTELDLSDKDYDYTVGPGDVLQIIVWDHPETVP